MHFIPTAIDSWYNLPRSRGVAYAAQESWVQNETIRDNILFGSPYDEERYQKGDISMIPFFGRVLTFFSNLPMRLEEGPGAF